MSTFWGTDQLWAGKDSNLRRRKPTDLQSVPFNHFGTDPLFYLFTNFLKAFPPLYDFIFNSLLYASFFELNSSKYTTTHGLNAFVDFTKPLLCLLNLVSISAQWPT